MESAITWAVVWGILAFATSAPLGWLVGIGLGGIGVTVDQDWLAITGLVIGWFAGIAWFILCIVWSVQSILTAVQLA